MCGLAEKVEGGEVPGERRRVAQGLQLVIILRKHARALLAALLLMLPAPRGLGAALLQRVRRTHALRCTGVDEHCCTAAFCITASLPVQ
jgi:hypothetical protein